MTAINSNRAIRGPVTAVPVVAGKGVRLVADTDNNRWVVEADETVLWEASNATPGDTQQTYNLSESATNFEKVAVYIARPVTGNRGISYVVLDMKLLSDNNISSFSTPISFVSSGTHYSGQYNASGILSATWVDEQSGQVAQGATSYGKGYYAHITKIVGINRVASA